MMLVGSRLGSMFDLVSHSRRELIEDEDEYSESREDIER